MVEYIVDVAGSYQAGLSARAVAEQGYSALLYKVTEGLTRNVGWDATNKRWAKTWDAAGRDAGLITGGYHYLRAKWGAEQARYFVDELDLITGRGAEGRIIYVDVESDSSLGDVVSFMDELRFLTSEHPVLCYTGSWWWGPRAWDGATLTPYLFDSHYVFRGGFPAEGYASQVYPAVPDTWWRTNYGSWDHATFLQFTSRGRIDGYPGHVDLSAFRGTRAQLSAFTSGGDMTPEQARQLDDVWNRLIQHGWGGQSTFGRHNSDGTPATNFSQALEGAVQAILFGDGKGAPVNSPTVSHSLASIGTRLASVESALADLKVGGVDLDALAGKVVDRLLSDLHLVQRPAGESPVTT